MTNVFIIIDTGTGRVAEVQSLPDAYAPALGARQRAVLTATGQVASGTFTGTGSSAGAVRNGPFAVTVWGTFLATVCLEASYDGGTTWLPVVDDEGLPAKLQVPGQIVYTSTESAVLFRVTCPAYASGAASWQIGQ